MTSMPVIESTVASEFSKTNDTPENMKHPDGKSTGWEGTSLVEKTLMIGALISLLLVVVILSVVLRPYKAGETCVTPECINVATTILNAMNRSADPCTDFHQYACGNWIKAHPIPSQNVLGTKISEAYLSLKNVLEDDSIKLKGDAERNVRIYYNSCMNKNKKLKAEAMLSLLKKVGGWNISGDFNISQWNFQKSLEIHHSLFIDSGLFSWADFLDVWNNSRYIMLLHPTTFGINKRDFYLNMSKEEEEGYLSKMTAIGVLLGGKEKSTRAQMKDVIDFEKSLAKISIPEIEMKDFTKWTKKTISQLNLLAPVINWTKYFNFMFKQVNRTIAPTNEIIVSGSEFFQKMSELVKEYLSKPEKQIIISNYLSWSLVSYLIEAEPSLKVRTDDSLTLCDYELVGDTNSEPGVLTDVLGAIFIREVYEKNGKFTEDYINQIEGLVRVVRDIFKRNVPQQKWIDPDTAKLLIEKADAMKLLIGYDKELLDSKKMDKKYKGLEFRKEDYYCNKITWAQFTLKLNMLKLHEPVDRNVFTLPAINVNAVYSPNMNHIEILSGILQAPFYDPRYPMYVNFGSMGVITGHEFTHAFDSTGWFFDKFGNYNHWWKNSTAQSFLQKTQCFVEQYSSYEMYGKKLNGQQTLSEDIADCGSLKITFNAYQDWVTHHAKELPLPDVPLTNNQVFFVVFAQTWCDNIGPENTADVIQNQGHTVDRFRVIGSVSNSYEFAREFNCPAKSAMNPQKKCILW